MSGEPLGTGDVLAQPIPDPPSGRPSHTCEWEMGRGELLFTPLAPGRDARWAVVPLGPWLPILFLPRLHQALGRFCCQISLHFCVACPLIWSSPPLGGPSFWCASDTRPRPPGCPSGLRLNRSRLGQRLRPGWAGWPPGAYPTAFAGTPPSFCPSWVLSHPRLSGSHLTTASTPNCR
jgi:hypothetical protein